MYKHDREALKKARYYPVRFREPETGRMKLIQVTRAYDQAAGIMRFEDIEENRITRENILDDGILQLVDEQDVAVMEDAGRAVFEQERGGGVTLTAEDIAGPVPSTPVAEPSSSATQQAGGKRARRR